MTTHKIDLYEAAQDMFEYLDPYAQLTGEMSSISKLDGRLEGHAKDPITAGLSLDAIIDKNYFGRTGGDVLLFGAGGSALATMLHLMDKPNAATGPSGPSFVNRCQPRLAAMRELVAGTAPISNSSPCKPGSRTNDQFMESPAAIQHRHQRHRHGQGHARLAHHECRVSSRWTGIAWEFNYRGELDFMHQALAQEASRRLKVEDGWVYFVHGWTQVVAQVLHIDLTPEVFSRLEAAAATVRAG